MKLTKVERVMLWNQLQIMKTLKVKGVSVSDINKHCEALENGYAAEYGRFVEHFSDEMSKSECAAVKDILDFHRAIHFAVKKHGPPPGLKAKDLEFKGFDGNNESAQLGYAKYLIETLGLWAESRRLHNDYNTHSPTLDRYERMLPVWRSAAKRHEISKSELSEIAQAGWPGMSK